MRDGGLPVFVDGDPALLVQGKPGRLKIQFFDVRLTPQRDQHLFALDRHAVRQPGDDGGHAVPHHFLDGLSHVKPSALPFDAALKHLDDFRVHERQGTLGPIDERDFDTQQRKGRGIFAGDDPSAQDRQRAGQVDHRQDRIAVQHMFVIDRNFRNRTRSGPRGQHDRVGSQGLAGAVDGLQFHFMRREKSRASVSIGHAVAGELVGHVTLVRLHHLIQAVQQHGHGHIKPQPSFEHFTRAFETLELQCRLAQRLTGNRAPVHTVAADALFLFDQDDFLAGLGALNGGLLAGRTAPHHHDVIGIGGHHNGIASTTACTLSFRASSASISLG